jgi:uncharacterized protein (TIGR00255 family)
VALGFRPRAEGRDAESREPNMLRSMTGFASLTREDERATVGVTIRAVNHRYLDVQMRLPPGLMAAESRLRALLQRRLARGRIELSVSVQLREPPPPEIEIHVEFVRRLSAAIDRVREEGLVSGSLTAGDLVRIPQALVVREASGDAAASADGLTDVVEAAVDETLTALDTMRVREGGHLGADLDGRRAGLAVLIERVAEAAAEGQAGIEARLTERVKELSRELPADPAAIAQEIVRTAARSDISEEVVRFRAHLAHWTALAEAEEPCGRKFDFLLQEMNREINTIGSKADGLGVTELIVTAKAELEKMREQVQNVE